MKSIVLLCALALVSLAPRAHAEEEMKSQQMHCSGSYFVYSFVMHASVVGTKIHGPVAVTIVDGSGQSHDMKLTAAASDVREGQYIHMTGSSPDGTGVLSADYNSGSYGGSLNANTKYGNANVDVTCTLGSNLEDFE